MDKAYEAPAITEMGTLSDLTQGADTLVLDTDIAGIGSA
jgi:hypothetical protein